MWKDLICSESLPQAPGEELVVYGPLCQALTQGHGQPWLPRTEPLRKVGAFCKPNCQQGNLSAPGRSFLLHGA